MQIDLKSTVDVVLGLIALAAVVYRIGGVEASIKQEISRVNNRFDVHLTEYAAKKEMLDYLIHSLDEKINHKFNRLHANQREIQEFLSKNHNFVIRGE